MSLHKTLKSKSSLVRHRNVLTRAERIEKLTEDDRWDESMEPFALPKVAHRKATVGGKVKKAKSTATEAGTEESSAKAG